MSRTLAVRIINATGASDASSELETNLLLSLLPMYSKYHDHARAEVEVVRTTTPDRLLRYLFRGDADIIHLVSHGDEFSVQVGAFGELTFADVDDYVSRTGESINAVVFGAACSLGSDLWIDTWLDAGASAYIAPRAPVLVRDLAVFETAYYSALLARIGVNKSDVQRHFDAYRLARATQRSLSPGSGSAQFYWHSRLPVKGRTLIPTMRLS